MSTIIGVDVGGTKIAAGTVTLDAAGQPRVTAELRIPTPRSNAITGVLEAIAQALELSDAPKAGIGIGAPGVIDPSTGQVVSSGPTMAGWAGTQIKQEVERAVGLPVAVHNDVRVLGLGEARFGAGREFTNILFCSLGTGVGGAIVRNHSLMSSPHHTAGELRRLYGRLPNGQAALIEDFASGTGVARQYNATGRWPQARDLHEIMDRIAAPGGAHEGEFVAELFFCAGEAIGGFASAIDVDAIVLGGGVTSIGEFVTEPFARGVRAGAIPPMDQVPVRVATLGPQAPIIGAASLLLP